MENWQKIPNTGDWVKSSHPRTCLNPDEFFQVCERKIEGDKVYIRGENTCWFHIDMISAKET